MGQPSFQLRDFELFNHLDDEEVEVILSNIHFRNFPKNTQIITEGDESLSLYFLLHGSAKVYLNDETGKEFIIDVLQAGSYFGELGLIKSIHRTASVMTMQDSRMGIMRKPDFSRILSTYPSFSLGLIESLSTRLIESTETIRKLGLMDVYHRISATFLKLSKNENGIRVIHEKLTQQNIADRIGASREMVAIILKDLRDGGYISQEHNKIFLHKALPHSW